MQAEVAEKLYSIKQYLAFEERAERKHEYFCGKIVTVPHKNIIHNIIAVNIIASLGNALHHRNFIINNSDIKFHIPRYDSIVYPDAVTVFEKPELYEGRDDVILNPLLIVEIASLTTKKRNRSLKFHEYKSLPSFKEYVFVEQTQPSVIASYKIADRTWKDTEANTLDGSVYLQSVDCTLDLGRIYHGIQFTKPV